MATFAELAADDEESAAPKRATLSDLAIDDDAPTAVVKAAKPGAPTAELPWYSRAAQGLKDPIVGTGQLVQNVLPDPVANWLRKPESTAALGGIFPAIPAVGAALTAAGGGAPTTTEDVNQRVSAQEGAYQGQRQAAGQKGLDLWRVAGNVANPMSWAGGGGAATLGQAAARGAGTGVIQALMQPVTSGDSYAMSKATQSAIGAGAGGVLGAALFGVGRGRSEVIKSFKSKGGAAATETTNELLEKAGAEPAKVNPSVYTAIRQEVDDALSQGVNPDPKVMFNRADAASLPVPVQLTRGQASRDPMRFSWEVNNSKLAGAGEQLSERIQQQNRALIENLNVLGAKDAPTTFDTSKQLIGHIEKVDAAVKSKIDEAYKAVRNSAGQPALMDQEAFQRAARESLESGQLTEFVPETIKKQYNALAQGNIPLTVDTAQTLDRVWSAEQRAATGSTKMAIGELRKALNAATVKDSLGEQAMQAYQAAREMARQRFASIEANPAYKAVTDGVEPDKFFQQYVQGANVAELGRLKQLIGPENTGMLQRTFLGQLKERALNRASDDNGVFSQAAYNKVLKDPVQAPRIGELFKETPQTIEQLQRLGRVAENVIAFPKGHGVNTSNTAPTAANIIRDVVKSEAGASLWNMIPGARAIREVGAQHAAQRAVSESLAPGVTAAPLQKLAPPAKVGKLSDLITRVGAAGAARELGNKREQRSDE